MALEVSDIFNILESQNLNGFKDFLKKNVAHFKQYNNLIREKGTSINFNIHINDDICFTTSNYYNLCTTYLNNILNERELNFIVDIIIASVNNFENDELQEGLELLTDPEVHGALNKEKVNRYRDEFSVQKGL